MALIFALTVVVFVLLYFGPYRNPGLALAGLCRLALPVWHRRVHHRRVHPRGRAKAVRRRQRGAGQPNPPQRGGEIAEQRLSRRRARGPRPTSSTICKPSAIAPSDDKVEKSIEPSKLRGGRQLAHGMSVAHEGSIDDNRLRKLPSLDRSVLGKVLFLYHCNDCHAGRVGYSALGPLLQGRPRSVILDRIERLDDVYFMPPWCGTDEEAEVLTDYLMTISPRQPPGKRPWENKAAAPNRRKEHAMIDPKMLIDPTQSGHARPGLVRPVLQGPRLHAAYGADEPLVRGPVDRAGAPSPRQRAGRRFAGRLLQQMPIIVAFGINFGIVPLLFMQLAYYKVFYPATILMACFWLAIIVLLIPAYYGVYAYALGLSNSGDYPVSRRGKNGTVSLERQAVLEWPDGAGPPAGSRRCSSSASASPSPTA